MINVDCVFCKKELEELGAILLSPPYFWEGDQNKRYVKKHHICEDCYKLKFPEIAT